MNRLLRSATSFLLVTLMMSLTVLTSPFPSASANANAIQNSKEKAPDKRVKVLKGEAVKQLIQERRRTNKALDRALRDMEKLGKYPDWESSAFIKDVQPPKGAQTPKQSTVAPVFRKVSYSPQQEQQYFSDGNGNEMTVITAYGDDAVWDGTIHTYDASTGVYETYNGVVDDTITGDLDSSDVIDELYYPQGGGDPVREEPCYSGERCMQMEVQLASSGSAAGRLQVVNASYAPAVKSPANTVGFMGWFKRYFRCIKRCQALRTAACASQSTFRKFFICLAIGATASSIQCAFNTSSCQ